MTLKKYIALFALLVITIQPARAQLDPRIKALGAMALYGTVGGALLGTASLAFGADGRSVAKGASLGLYAGIIFGSYVVISHAYKKHLRENPKAQENYYPGVNSPYEGFEGGGYGEEMDPAGGYRWEPVKEMTLQSLREVNQQRERIFSQIKKTPVEVFVPLLNVSF